MIALGGKSDVPVYFLQIDRFPLFEKAIVLFAEIPLLDPLLTKQLKRIDLEIILPRLHEKVDTD